MTDKQPGIDPAPMASGPGINYNPRTARAKRLGGRAALYTAATFFVLFAAPSSPSLFSLGAIITRQ